MGERPEVPWQGKALMATRVCGHSTADLLAIGFTKTEAVKWRKIASRYRSRKKPEPPPGPWLERYRNKIKDGWTCKSKRPADVDVATWMRYQRYTSRCRCNGQPFDDVYTYMARITPLVTSVEKPAPKPERYKRMRKADRVVCKADVKNIAARCRQIVAAKLREQGLSLPPLKK